MHFRAEGLPQDYGATGVLCDVDSVWKGCPR
jgi:hypothetical protein